MNERLVRQRVGRTNYIRVAEALRSDIYAGRLLPGERLRLTEIAARFGVSVQPVREALQQLEGERMVELIPNQGARVARIDRQRLIHQAEIGAALEIFFSRQFADEAPPASLRRAEALQKAHDAAIADLDWLRIDATNFAFHHFINTHGGNVEAAELLERSSWYSASLLNRRGRDPSFADRVLREHHELLDAFRRRDMNAAGEIAATHVRSTLEEVLAAYDLLVPEVRA